MFLRSSTPTSFGDHHRSFSHSSCRLPSYHQLTSHLMAVQGCTRFLIMARSVLLAIVAVVLALSSSCCCVDGLIVDPNNKPVPVTLEWEDLTYSIVPSKKNIPKVILNNVSKRNVYIFVECLSMAPIGSTGSNHMNEEGTNLWYFFHP